MAAKLSDAEIKALRRMKTAGATWRELARSAGLTTVTIRRLLNPEHRERMNLRVQLKRLGPLVEEEIGPFQPPPDLQWRTPFGEVLGEPAVGRSALDRRDGVRPV